MEGYKDDEYVEPAVLREKLVEALSPVIERFDEESETEYLNRASQVLDYFANYDRDDNSESQDTDHKEEPTSDRYD